MTPYEFIKVFREGLSKIGIDYTQIEFLENSLGIGMKITFKSGISYGRLRTVLTTINAIHTYWKIDYNTLFLISNGKEVVLNFKFKNHNIKTTSKIYNK